MFKGFRYIFMRAILLPCSINAGAQLAMPDNVYLGATKHYNVNPNPVPGSIYTWKIDGVLQDGSNTNEIDITWNTAGTYLLEVQEQSLDGCLGSPISGQVFVTVTTIEIKAIIAVEETTPGAGGILIGACQQIKLDASKSIGNIIKYEWSIPDQGGALSRQSGISTEFFLSPDYIGSLPADFRVRLLLTDKMGNANSDTLTIKVDGLPIAEVYSSGKLEKDGSLMVDGTVSNGTALNYQWFTSEGKIIGPDNQSTAKFFGAGIYKLEITDNHGCKSIKNFKFPLELYQIMANPDYARISWLQDTTINVLGNDRSTVNFLTGAVRIVKPPALGEARANTDGSITYTPGIKQPGHDQFIYEVCNEVGLCASATVTIDIYDIGITIPEGFSPNGDGVNDLFEFKGLESNSQIYIYMCTGQLVFQSDDYRNNWNGTTMKNTLTNGGLVPTGIYYYVLKMGGRNRSIKGFIYIGY